jgi:hypothetical protein
MNMRPGSYKAHWEALGPNPVRDARVPLVVLAWDFLYAVFSTAVSRPLLSTFLLCKTSVYSQQSQIPGLGAQVAPAIATRDWTQKPGTKTHCSVVQAPAHSPACSARLPLIAGARCFAYGVDRCNVTCYTDFVWHEPSPNSSKAVGAGYGVADRQNKQLRIHE